MTENQLNELLEKHAEAVIDHITSMIKDTPRVSKKNLYAALAELRKYPSWVDDSSYSFEKVQAIDAIDAKEDQLQVLASMQSIAVELVNYGNQEQKSRFVDLVANSDSPEGLDYSCNYAPIIHDGNNSFDV